MSVMIKSLTLLLAIAVFSIPAFAQQTDIINPTADAQKAIANSYKDKVADGSMTVEQAMDAAIAEAGQQNIPVDEFVSMLTESLFMGATQAGLSSSQAVSALSKALYRAAAKSEGGTAFQAGVLANGILGIRSGISQTGASEEQVQALNGEIVSSILSSHQEASADSGQDSIALDEIAMENVLNTATTDPIAATYTEPGSLAGQPAGQQSPSAQGPQAGQSGPAGPGNPADATPPGGGGPGPGNDFDNPASPV